MICPKCHKPMERKSMEGNIWYWECQVDGTTIGKPEKESEEDEE